MEALVFLCLYFRANSTKYNLYYRYKLVKSSQRVKRHIRNSGSPLPRRSKVFPKMRSHSPPHEDYFSYNRRPYLYDGGNAYIPGDGVDYRSASEYGVDPGDLDSFAHSVDARAELW